MTVISPSPTGQRAPAPAKLRILATADELFYEEGIRTVGIDRLISASVVTKATFYKHYRSKDLLILDYVRGRHQQVRAEIEMIVSEAPDSPAAIEAFASAIVEQVATRGFRGCPFLNAAAEFAEPDHPVRRIVGEHRDWLTDQLVDLARGAGHPTPGDAADELMLARDGALAGGYAGDPVAASAALTRIVDCVLTQAQTGARQH